MSVTALTTTSHSFNNKYIKNKYTLSLADIYRLALAGWTREEIAEMFGVRIKFINFLIQFADIKQDEEYSVLVRTRVRGRLSEEMKKRIQELLLKGHSNYYIARKLGINIFDVNKVMREVFPGMGRW